MSNIYGLGRATAMFLGEDTAEGFVMALRLLKKMSFHERAVLAQEIADSLSVVVVYDVEDGASYARPKEGGV